MKKIYPAEQREKQSAFSKERAKVNELKKELAEVRQELETRQWFISHDGENWEHRFKNMEDLLRRQMIKEMSKYEEKQGKKNTLITSLFNLVNKLSDKLDKFDDITRTITKLDRTGYNPVAIKMLDSYVEELEEMMEYFRYMIQLLDEWWRDEQRVLRHLFQLAGEDWEKTYKRMRTEPRDFITHLRTPNTPLKF